jgi:hypothetical protein
VLRSMVSRKLLWICLALVYATSPAFSHTLSVNGNRIYLDGKKGQILYESSGDLDGDGKRETAFLAWTYDEGFSGIVVARQRSISQPTPGMGGFPAPTSAL